MTACAEFYLSFINNKQYANTKVVHSKEGVPMGDMPGPFAFSEIFLKAGGDIACLKCSV